MFRRCLVSGSLGERKEGEGKEWRGQKTREEGTYGKGEDVQEVIEGKRARGDGTGQKGREEGDALVGGTKEGGKATGGDEKRKERSYEDCRGEDRWTRAGKGMEGREQKCGVDRQGERRIANE